MLKIINHPRPEFNGKYCIVDVIPDSQTRRMNVQGFYVGPNAQYQLVSSKNALSCPHVFHYKSQAQGFLNALQVAANDP